MEFVHRQEENRLLAKIGGKIGPGDAEELYHRLTMLMMPAHHEILLDISNVSIVSSNALAKLSLLNNRVTKMGKRLFLTGVSQSLFRLFDVVGLDSLVIDQPATSQTQSPAI